MLVIRLQTVRNSRVSGHSFLLPADITRSVTQSQKPCFIFSFFFLLLIFFFVNYNLKLVSPFHFLENKEADEKIWLSWNHCLWLQVILFHRQDIVTHHSFYIHSVARKLKESTKPLISLDVILSYLSTPTMIFHS